MAGRRKSGDMGQGRKNADTSKPYKTVWKKPVPSEPREVPRSLTVTHTDCGTSWQIPRGASGPGCSVCGRI